jgi:hypothetical protein
MHTIGKGLEPDVILLVPKSKKFSNERYIVELIAPCTEGDYLDYDE